MQSDRHRERNKTEIREQQTEGPCGTGLAPRGPSDPSQSHFISETSCPLSPEFTSAALTGQDWFIICCVTWKWLIDHRSIKEGKEYQAQKAEVAPGLITIALVALLKTQKQCQVLIKSCPRWTISRILPRQSSFIAVCGGGCGTGCGVSHEDDWSGVK